MAYCSAAAKQEFDSWSHRYDRDWLQVFFFGPSHRMLLEHLSASEERILDIGCGTGLFASQVLKSFPQSQVWGMDLSDGMLRQCWQRCQDATGRFHLVQGDSSRLPFRDDAFDVVTCTHSFHHYPCQERVIAEMYRVLKPDGRLLIIDGDCDRLWGHLLFDILVVLVEGPVKHLTSAAFRNLYGAAGFAQVSQHRRGGPLPFLLTIGCAQKPYRSLSGQQAA
jgi:ubiquinone/menaquinone biosynthesis C-methylase UbiE